MWWQTRPGGRAGDRDRWTREAEHAVGPWGKLYVDDGRVTGVIQYAPSELFPRALTMPAGPPSRDAVLITCAYLTDVTSPWVLQSLFLAAIGETNDRGYPALEAFAYRYGQGAEFGDRFLSHRTIFPVDFLRDFGFQPQRTAGRVELARLELRGLLPASEPSLVERLKARFAPVPAPAVR
jgi:hypothetical protein